MAIDPRLVSIKTAGELPVSDPSDNANFLFYEDEALKRSPMSNIYEKLQSGIKGVATAANSPTAWSPGDPYLFERYSVDQFEVKTNFKDASNNPIEVTSADLDGNLVEIWVENGVARKVVMPLPEGKSAYQVALDNGFVGTEAEWLASLEGTTPTVELKLNDDLDPLLYTTTGALGTAYPYLHARFKPAKNVSIQKVYFDISGNNAGFTKLSIYKSVNGSNFTAADLILTQTIAPTLSALGNNYYEAAINPTDLDSNYTYVFVFSGTGTFQPKTVAKSGFAGNLTGTFDFGRANTETSPTYLSTHVYKPLIFDRFVFAENLTEVNDSLNLFDKKITALSAIAGKKYAALGDSITLGYPPANYTPPTNPLKSYAFLAAERLGLQFTNYGITGSRLANLDGLGGANPMSERYTAMIDDADIISVMGGTNDRRNGVPLGTISDTTNQTYYGALKVTAEGLINKYWTGKGEAGAEKLIFFIIPPKHNASTTEVAAQISWRQAVIDVCRLYSLPYLDFYYESTITPDQMRTLDVSGSLYNPFITDAVHPTQEGHIRMAKVLKKFIAGYF